LPQPICLSFVGVFLAAGAYYLFASGLHQTARGIFLDRRRSYDCDDDFMPSICCRIHFCGWCCGWGRIQFTGFAWRGESNIPETGGALFVANHMSLVDALLLLASTDRPIRFLMYKGIYDLPFVKPGAKMIRAIPISSELRPREMLQSLREASNAIRRGESGLHFLPKGRLHASGQLLPFRRGMERIMKGVDAPIVPVNLDGVWGSIFSASSAGDSCGRCRGRFRIR